MDISPLKRSCTKSRVRENTRAPRTSQMPMAMMSNRQLIVTAHPAGVKRLVRAVSDIPVSRMKLKNTGIWAITTTSESTAMMAISMTLSVTTVPTPRVKPVPS